MNEIQYIQKHGVKSACELIELLGGYEKAKAEFAEQLKAEKQYPNEKENNERILLDYRRVHNIFEIGDQIVSTLKGDDFWMRCVCTIEAFHKKMAITNGAGHTIHHYEYRHITNAEREANRRLDQ